jgi:hypothetical protein
MDFCSIVNYFNHKMYLDIHTLEIADGLKDTLVHSDFTFESILKHGPSKIASIMRIDPYVAEIIFPIGNKNPCTCRVIM